MKGTSLEGRAAIVTGAGDGLGKAEAMQLAHHGASVVVNDLGSSADEVAAEIRSLGGRATAVRGDIGDWALSDRLVETAVQEFGSLDIVVNNAGVTRDAMIFNLTEAMWDEVIRVHLKGHAALSRAAAAHWRAASKEAGEPVYGRVVNTASEAFLFGGPGQANYAAAKSGIVALTLSLARGLSRYGVTANAIAPRARTAMTEGVFDKEQAVAFGGLDALAPERVATFVSYLASPAASAINGQVFVVYGDMVALLAPPTVERKFTAPEGVFTPQTLEAQLGEYFQDRSPEQNFMARSVANLDAIN